MPAFDAVICGAGVGGLTLAHILGRAGRRVLLVEKQRRPRTVHKGELLQPRSLEILQGIDLLPHMSARGVVRVDRLICRTAQGAELVPLGYGMLPGPFNHGLIHYYHQMKEAIAGQLGPSVEFWRGVRVEDLIRDSIGRVAGVRLLADGERIDVDAPLTVAADGHASRLREAAGIHVPMRRYGHHLVAFDIGGVPGLGQDMAAYLTRDGLRVLFQMPGDRARLYVQIPSGGFRDVGRAGLPEWIDRLLRTVPALAPIAGPLRESQHGVQVLSAWRFNAPAPTRPGVVLLGDAAHCVHPMVGQGMNAQDFAVLLVQQARASGIELKPENVAVSDGLIPVS